MQKKSGSAITPYPTCIYRYTCECNLCLVNTLLMSLTIAKIQVMPNFLDQARLFPLVSRATPSNHCERGCDVMCTASCADRMQLLRAVA